VDSCQATSVSPTATRATRAAIGRPPDDCRLFDESTGSFIFEAVRWGTVVGRAFGRGRHAFKRRKAARCWFDPKKSSARTRERSERSYVVEVESVRRKPVFPVTGYSFRSTVKSLGPGA